MLWGDHSSEGIAILTAEPWRASACPCLHGDRTGVERVGLVVHRESRRDRNGTGARLAPCLRAQALLCARRWRVWRISMVAEGQPVAKGDVLARLNARGAVEAASNAMQAQLKLEDAEREWRQFPERKGAVGNRRLQRSDRRWNSRSSNTSSGWRSGRAKLVEEEKAQMAEARTNVEETRAGAGRSQAGGGEVRARPLASPGGSGVSQLQVEAKRKREVGRRECLPRGAIESQRTHRSSKPGARTGPGPARCERRAAQEAAAGVRSGGERGSRRRNRKLRPATQHRGASRADATARHPFRKYRQGQFPADCRPRLRHRYRSDLHANRATRSRQTLPWGGIAPKQHPLGRQGRDRRERPRFSCVKACRSNSSSMHSRTSDTGPSMARWNTSSPAHQAGVADQAAGVRSAYSAGA